MYRKLIICLVLSVLIVSNIFAYVGDANGDDDVDIIDALVIAQFYVNLEVRPFLAHNCDVNDDGYIDIIDALNVARYYVGLLDAFTALPVEISTFQTPDELIDAFEKTFTDYPSYWDGAQMRISVTPAPGATIVPTPAATSEPVPEPTPAPESDSPQDFSTTNIQVQGVDEADILKTDGNYVYMLTKGKLVIADSYPPQEARILSETNLTNITPLEMFVHDDKLMVYGSINYTFDGAYPTPPPPGYAGYYYVYPSYYRFVTVRLYDITDRENPALLRNVEIEGTYLTSRKIGPHTYFVINSNPYYDMDTPTWQDIVPVFRDGTSVTTPTYEDMTPLCSYNQIAYCPPIQAQRFLTVASISMEDENAEMNKQVIVGSGQNVYCSMDNIYVAQTTWPYYTPEGSLDPEFVETTHINKFAIFNGIVEYAGSGEAKGHILNQFSMDEYNYHLRIATTTGFVSQTNPTSANHVYILDIALNEVGALEGLAPGEKLYSVRFAGEKGYLVTFKKVDPFFVLDLSDHTNPIVTGELKIPGYSDYLHPLDENHVIGLGKNTVEAESGNFAWYQGIKLAVYDVSDPANPIELHLEVIGERGTDSEALREHKAFLYSKEKNLLVIPVTVAEFETPPEYDWQTGLYVFQGAYVYDLTIENGFNLRGRITHEDNPTVNPNGGYTFDSNRRIRRTLYIEDALYTFSNNRLQLNDLNTLDRIKFLEF